MILRLDTYLKRVGLIKQRLLAKKLCEQGAIELNGRPAKAGKDVGKGDIIQIRGLWRNIEIRVVDLPERNYKYKDGQVFYRVLKVIEDM
ncbi:MAG: S4 domain-containing protein [bacterium]